MTHHMQLLQWAVPTLKLWDAKGVCCVDRCQPKSVGGEEKLFVTDPWGQEFMVLQGGKAGDFPMSMGMSEVQLPVHAGELHRQWLALHGRQ